ncbi:hypothetical protein ACIQU4_42255 [Streptomyces sp. NPDC090741]
MAVSEAAGPAKGAPKEALDSLAKIPDHSYSDARAVFDAMCG